MVMVVDIRPWREPSRIRRDISKSPQYVSVTSRHEGVTHYHSLDFSIVTVTVGSGDRAEAFLVHEPLLRASSAIARECLTRPCREEKERHMLIPKCDPETFRIYAQFLNTGLMYTIPLEAFSEYIPAGSLVAQNIELESCLKAYCLAAHLEDANFADAAVDALVEIMTEVRSKFPGMVTFFTDESVKFLYRCSKPGSPVRTLITDWGLIAMDHTGFNPDGRFRSRDPFLCDLYVALRAFWVGERDVMELVDPFGGMTGCRYHEHQVVGKPCYRDRLG